MWVFRGPITNVKVRWGVSLNVLFWDGQFLVCIENYGIWIVGNSGPILGPGLCLRVILLLPHIPVENWACGDSLILWHLLSWHLSEGSCPQQLLLPPITQNAAALFPYFTSLWKVKFQYCGTGKFHKSSNSYIHIWFCIREKGTNVLENSGKMGKTFTQNKRRV